MSSNEKKLEIVDIEFNYSEILANDLYAIYWFNNTFTTFKSINDILYLIYTNEKNSIIAYNLIDNKKINEVKKAHYMHIISFRYILDINNKRDLIISISADDNNIKLWNINNWELLTNIENINENGFLYSSCFLNDNNQNYIITSNFNSPNSVELIKVFNFKGIKINEINNSNDNTLFIDIYYDNISSNNYIITGNKDYIKSYDYNNNKLYKIYSDNNIGFHYSIIINKKDEHIELIESCEDGNIRIWGFHSAELIKIINIIKGPLFDICLWNNEYLFVGCVDNIIKIINLKNGAIIKDLVGHNNRVITIKKISHPLKGDCIISQGWVENKIRLWINKK